MIERSVRVLIDVVRYREEAEVGRAKKEFK